MVTMAIDSEHWRGAADAGRSRQLVRELALAGVGLRLPVDAEGRVSGGASLAADAGTIADSAGAASRFADLTLDLLQGGMPLTVVLAGREGRGRDEDRFRRFCGLLGAVRRAAGARSDAIGICLDGAALPPRTALSIRRTILGTGPVYLVAGPEQLHPGRRPAGPDANAGFWTRLWQLRSEAALRVVHACSVLSHCPLLAPERAAGVSAAGAIQAPAGSAWTVLRLDLSRFADGRGRIVEAVLDRALSRCVEVGDLLHDRVVWPTACMRHDAWLNRRLGIFVDGIGDIAARRRVDPRRFACLAMLGDVLHHVRRTLMERSAAVAAACGSVPALVRSDPSAALPGGDLRDGWSRCWRDAAAACATRHRNLVVMSPWSIFPSGAPADLRYADLLPLLRYADACAFPEPPRIAAWNVNEFRGFHQRVWAVLGQRDTAHSIAERP
jgi:hypothetical protein